MDAWKTTVAELLEIFRSALVALLPAMERARIPWRDGEAYDEWDEISQTLYKNVVARSLQWALGGELELDKVLPRYNMKLASYRNRSVLLVSGPRVAGEAVFVGLSSSEEPFDTVDCVHVNGIHSPCPVVKVGEKSELIVVEEQYGSTTKAAIRTNYSSPGTATLPVQRRAQA